MAHPADVIDVDRVVETSEVYGTSLHSGVNDYLEDGWVLLGTHLQGDEEIGQSRIYSLGRLRPDRHDLSEIVEVKECSRGMFEHDLSEVNAYLAAGWVMLSTFTRGDTREGQRQIYSVAWYRSKGEPVHPEFESAVDKYLREAAEKEATEGEEPESDF